MSINNSFFEACEENESYVLKRLIMIIERMDPCAEACKTFADACSNGNLEVARRLMTLEGMDPCAEECEAFDDA